VERVRLAVRHQIDLLARDNRLQDKDREKRQVRDEQFERWRQAEKAAARAAAEAGHHHDATMGKVLREKAQAMRAEADRLLALVLARARDLHFRAPKFESE
jgi:hypothetical protein